MEVKLLELRDKMTFIPIIAIKIDGHDSWLARRAGYRNPFILMGRLEGGRMVYDPNQWGDRTFKTAHLALIANWEGTPNESLIDVEYILGEKQKPSESEKIISDILIEDF